MSLFRLIFLLVTLSLGACAASTSYRPGDVPDRPIPADERITGRVMIYTTPTDDERVITAGATTLTGAGLKLTTPVGVMVREIALNVLSKAASDGAYESDDFTNASNYTIVFRPLIENFEYGYLYPKLGIDVTPEVRMTLRMTLLDATGSVMLEKDYDSGAVSGRPQKINRKLVEVTNELAHRAMYDLMRRAAADIHLFQKTQEAAAAN